MATWLLLTSFIYVYTNNEVLYITLSHIKEYKCLKNVFHDIDSKNEWMLLSASFTSKFELVFVEHWKALFARSFILNPVESAQKEW